MPTPRSDCSGTGATEVDTNGRDVRRVVPPVGDADIRRALIRRNVFVHSSVMVRRQALVAAGGYDAAFPVAQDYDLWLRLARITRLANLPEPLVMRRLLPGRISATREADRLRAEARVRWRELRAGHYPPWCVRVRAPPAAGARHCPRPPGRPGGGSTRAHDGRRAARYSRCSSRPSREAAPARARADGGIACARLALHRGGPARRRPVRAIRPIGRRPWWRPGPIA